MLVSIIIPTYNRSLFLEKALYSAVQQTYRPIECIVVDDGSTDNTNLIINRFRQKTDKAFVLKYLIQSNQGSQAARNKGTDIATGEFIQYLDSDDLLYSDKVTRQVEFLKSHPQCNAVFGDWEVGTQEKKESVLAYKSDDFISQLLTGRCIANFAMLMRTSLVKKIGDWDIDIKRNQEIDFHLRGILAGGNFEYQSGLCGLWRKHEYTRIATETGLMHIQQFYRKWENQLFEKKLFNTQLAKNISNSYMWLISQNKEYSRRQVIFILKETIRLNPEIDFYKNKKLRFIVTFLGKNMALLIWWEIFKNRIPNENEQSILNL